MNPWREMARAVYESVFNPLSLAGNKRRIKIVRRFGWWLIFIRWAYYSIVFLLRDYHGRWMPFYPPPFNLNLDTYVILQRTLSLPFGFFLMLVMSLVLTFYYRQRNQNASILTVLNILGVTFFLPFVLVQPIDQLIIFTIGWKIIPVTVIHTLILFWESWSATIIFSRIYNLHLPEQIISIILLFATWISITGCVWR